FRDFGRKRFASGLEVRRKKRKRLFIRTNSDQDGFGSREIERLKVLRYKAGFDEWEVLKLEELFSAGCFRNEGFQSNAIEGRFKSTTVVDVYLGRTISQSYRWNNVHAYDRRVRFFVDQAFDAVRY